MRGGPGRRRLRIKRAYEEPADDDGRRVLVDRLWPRGVSRAGARLDEWAKDVAPSDGLRRWYAHDAGKFPEFRRRYRAELASRGPALERLASFAGAGTVTLVCAARDPARSNAAVLREVLEDLARTLRAPGSPRPPHPPPRR